jgi:NodT family efflux transporter outer membrane factor (OMF) lipoprotein
MKYASSAGAKSAISYIKRSFKGPGAPRAMSEGAPWLAPLLASMLLLSACSSAPTYAPPSIDVPTHFKEAASSSGAPTSTSTGAATDVKAAALFEPARTHADAVPDAWWLLFNDPVLTALEQRVASRNQNIAASVAQLRAAQAAVSTSRASLLPQLSTNLGATRSGSGAAASTGVDANGNLVGSGSGRARTVDTLGLSASWEVDLWGRLSGAVDAAQARAQASADDLAALRLSTEATLAQTYLALRTNEAQAALLAETGKGYQQSLTLTRNRYKAGVISSADVAQAESQLQAVEAQRIEADTNRAQLEHALAILVGEAPASFSLAPTGVLPSSPALPELLPARLLERRPDIAAAERRVAAANAQIGVARAAYFPTLNLSAAAGYRASALGGLLSAPNLFWSLGPQLALSLFDGGARNAAVESARASTEQAAAVYRQAVLVAMQEVEDNLVVGAALERELGVLEAGVKSAQKALDVANNQYKAGMVGYLNVITAQASVLSAQRSLLDVRNRQLAAVNQLLKNIAGRWEPLATSANAVQPQS